MIAPLHITLYQPEIPPNTGNIARLCACTGCRLNLIHPLGFDINDKQLKRAGLDYWPHLDVKEFDNWESYSQQVSSHQTIYGLSSKASTSLWDTSFKAGDILLFGPETRGLPASILNRIQATRIPMREDAPVRSLNLSTACGIAVYEALRQINLSL